MKQINKLMALVHRILGTCLCLVIFMWFASGLVMVYHGNFPRPDRNGQLQRLDPLSETAGELLPVDSILPVAPSEATLSVDRYLGKTVFHAVTPDSTYHVTADGAAYQPVITPEYIAQVQQRWCSSPVERVDTLTDLMQWVPFGSQRAELPIYRYYFNDPEEHELFIGSKSGKVLQYTDADTRFWCYIGSIPHWVYFTWLREDVDSWRVVIYYLAGLCMLMGFTGLWRGVVARRMAKKQQKLSPYKKKWYHWHYLTGWVFGLFVLTYAFSGIMSLADVPEWLSHSSYSFSPARELGKLPSDAYQLDYRKVISAYPDATQIQWSHFAGHPYYTVTVKPESADDKPRTLYIDAASTQVQELMLTKTEVTEAVVAAFQANDITVQPTTVQMNENELYYRSRPTEGIAEYPIWKVSLEDGNGSVFYVHPATASVRYMDNTSRWGYWMYTALHTMRLPGVVNYEWLRQLLQWIFMLGGMGLSLTGIALAFRSIRRWVK